MSYSRILPYTLLKINSYSFKKTKERGFKDPKIYRPIALLNIVGKVMDKVLIKWILFIADAYGLLPHTYIGGRAAAGCEYTVYLLLKKIHAA